MRVSVITPTADQPMGMLLAERYMARQTVQPDQWIVADDGNEPAVLTMGQQHIVQPRKHDGGRSLAGNLLAALPHVDGDVVVIVEHDDWYSPRHIETCLAHLRNGVQATGAWRQRYFNVAHGAARLMVNVGSALCNTAFRSDLVHEMGLAAREAIRTGSYAIDRKFWDSLIARRVRYDVHHDETMVGIKGLPGRPGLGVGHRPGDGWTTGGTAAAMLRAWMGADAEEYL